MLIEISHTQAKILLSGLLLEEEEIQAALHGSAIPADDDPVYIDNLCTVFTMQAENKALQSANK